MHNKGGKQTKMAKKSLVLGAFMLAAGLVFAPSAQALTLIPPSFETSVDPGVAFDTQIKLFNETQNAIDLYPEVTTFTASGEDGTPTYDFSGEVPDIAAWFSLPNGPIRLEAGERRVVPITITPPNDAEPGGHYATVFFSTEPPEANEPGSVSLGTKLGSLFLLRVFGDVEESGNIVEFTVEEGSSFNRLPANFVTRFQNSGNIHLRPSGMIEVKNLLGSVSAELTVNQAGGATLPDSVRRYKTVWEKSTVEELPGNIWGDFWAEYRNEWNNFALGRYQATVSLEAGSGDLVKDSAVYTFWVMPWRVLTLMFLILIALVLLLIFGIKRYNHWILTRSQKQ